MAQKGSGQKCACFKAIYIPHLHAISMVTERHWHVDADVDNGAIVWHALQMVVERTKKKPRMSSQHMTSLSRQQHMIIAFHLTIRQETATRATMSTIAALAQMTRVKMTRSAKCISELTGPFALWSGSTHGMSSEMPAHGLANTR